MYGFYMILCNKALEFGVNFLVLYAKFFIHEEKVSKKCSLSLPLNGTFNMILYNWQEKKKRNQSSFSNTVRLFPTTTGLDLWCLCFCFHIPVCLHPCYNFAPECLYFLSLVKVLYTIKNNK